MVDNLERWHRAIRDRSGEPVSETFYITQPEAVGDEGVTVRYLSVTGENPARLPEGVYAETNVTPDSYNADFALRSLIKTHVTLALKDTSPQPETRPETVGPRMDFANSINYRQAFVTRAGALVMELSQGMEADARRLIQGVESGESRMKFTQPPQR